MFWFKTTFAIIKENTWYHSITVPSENILMAYFTPQKNNNNEEVTFKFVRIHFSLLNLSWHWVQSKCRQVQTLSACDGECTQYFHKTCAGLSSKELADYAKDGQPIWFCLKCKNIQHKRRSATFEQKKTHVCGKRIISLHSKEIRDEVLIKKKGSNLTYVGGENPSIINLNIIQNVSDQHKDNRPIYIAENITKFKKMLFKKARDLKKKNDIKYAWVKNGTAMLSSELVTTAEW